MPKRDVAVIIESSTQYGRELLKGISQYGRLHQWRLRYEQGGISRDEPGWLSDWQGGGVITRCPKPTHSLQLAEQGITVLFNSYFDSEGVGHYYKPLDHGLEVGTIAAEYFLNKGYQAFAFVGFEDMEYSQLRQQGYTERLGQAGYQVQSFCSVERGGESFQQLHAEECQFLRDLPKPCAVLVASDERGAQLLGTCQELNIAVPEEVAVLGVDNDPVLCEMAYPMLSSVLTDVARMGWLLAQHLDRLMNEEDVADMVKIHPQEVVERASTALDAVEDRAVAKALELIRTNIFEGITIEQVATGVALSRRTLERRFSKQLHTTVNAYMSKLLTDHIKSLLVETDYTLEHIAEIVGIEHMQRLYQLVRKSTGMTPSEYRRRFTK